MNILPGNELRVWHEVQQIYPEKSQILKVFALSYSFMSRKSVGYLGDRRYFLVAIIILFNCMFNCMLNCNEVCECLCTVEGGLEIAPWVAIYIQCQLFFTLAYSWCQVCSGIVSYSCYSSKLWFQFIVYWVKFALTEHFDINYLNSKCLSWFMSRVTTRGRETSVRIDFLGNEETANLNHFRRTAAPPTSVNRRCEDSGYVHTHWNDELACTHHLTEHDITSSRVRLPRISPFPIKMPNKPENPTAAELINAGGGAKLKLAGGGHYSSKLAADYPRTAKCGARRRRLWRHGRRLPADVWNAEN